MRASSTGPVVPGRPKREVYRDPRSQKHLGKAIRVFRRQAGLTQMQLGDRAEIDGNWISRIESGQVNPVWGNVRRIASALGVSLAELHTLVRDFELTEAVGLAVSAIRREQGFSPATVAKRAGLTPQELKKLESGNGTLVTPQMEGKLRKGLRVQKKRWFRALDAAKATLGIA